MGSGAAKTPAVRCRGLHVRGPGKAERRAYPVAESVVDECSLGQAPPFGSLPYPVEG